MSVKRKVDNIIGVKTIENYISEKLDNLLS